MSKAMCKPDCGYAWTVVGACFVINFIMAGLARSAGVLYIALIDTYGVTKEVATSPFTLRFCVRSMSGPLVGALGQRFGIRPVVLLGGVIAWIGGMICAVAPELTWITFGWGGLHGLGYGMSNVIHILMVTRYFNKYKGIALGIALAGDCTGSFLLPPILEHLLFEYDVKGTFLILAALSLHVVPAAMLLVPPLWEEPVKLRGHCKKMKTAIVEGKIMGEKGIANLAFEADETCKKERIRGLNDKCIDLHRPVITARVVDELFCDSWCKYPDSSNPPFIGNSHDVVSSDALRNSCHTDSLSLPVANPGIGSVIDIVGCNMLKDSSCEKSTLSVADLNRKNSQSILSCPLSNSEQNSVGMVASKIPEKNYFNSTDDNFVGDIMNPQYSKCDYHIHDRSWDSVKGLENGYISVTDQSYRPENLPCAAEGASFRERSSNCPENKSSTEPPKSSALLQFLITNTKPIFLLTGATLGLYCFLLISVLTIILDYANDCNIPSDSGKLLVMAFSVADVFGRLGFGVVLDKHWLAVAHYAGLTTSVMGLLIFVMPLWTNFIFWMVLFSICGCIQGGNSVMYPLLVEHYMEKKEQSVALGSLNFYPGLMMLPIPPMIGFFRDTMGAYDGVFWTTGGLCILVGCLWLLEPCLLRLNCGWNDPKRVNHGHCDKETI